MNHIICGYEECMNTEGLWIVVTDKSHGWQKRFCGYPHAILWMQSQPPDAEESPTK